jgi:hypothetical protein
MTRINHTDVFLRFSARDIPVLNAKNKLKFTFYGPLFCSFSIGISCKKINLKTISTILRHFLNYNTDTKTKENSKEQFEDHIK